MPVEECAQFVTAGCYDGIARLQHAARQENAVRRPAQDHDWLSHVLARTFCEKNHGFSPIGHNRSRRHGNRLAVGLSAKFDSTIHPWQQAWAGLSWIRQVAPNFAKSCLCIES